MWLIFGLGTAAAQSAASGTVSGQVADPQGAAIGGASVRLIDVSTNGVRTTLTNETGRYDFVNVPPGTYDLTVSKSSFSLAKISAQKVEVGLSVTLDVVLQLGTTTTTVEVAASAGSQLQVLNATIGSTISGDALMLIPNLGRDATALATLQVGVAPGGQVAGTQTDQSAFLLDGGNNSDDMAGS